MEVYLENLPPDLTDQGLQKQLSRFTKALSIQDWTCQKPRKRPYGFLTFLHHKDGERFLKQHQRQVYPSTQLLGKHPNAQLQILGNTVRCKVSNKAPDKFLLKSLVKSAEDRVRTEKQRLQPKENKIIFSLHSLSSGYYTYRNEKLAYAPEVEWTAVTGFAKFTKHTIIIEFETQANRQRVEIPYRIVEAMTIGTQPTALTLTLWEAPRLFHIKESGLAELMAGLSIGQKNLTPRTRLVGLTGGTGDHREAIGQALVYRLCVSSTEFGQMNQMLLEREILTLHYCEFTLLSSYERKSLVDGAKQLKRTVQAYSSTIPFSVLYQAEALFRNGFLPPWTVQRLLEMIANRSKGGSSTLNDPTSKSSSVTARAIRTLFSQIPFPGPDSDASAFDAEEIWKYFEENEKLLREGFAKDLISEKGRLNLTMVHRVNITPTGMTLHGPEPEAKNRILRRFPDHTEHFIRVQFCEEDGSDIQFNSRVSNQDVYKRFEDVFNKGINIGGRVYGFLGFSHSSLRSHAAWFMAPFVYEGKLQTYFTIISFLGNFQDITSPARCAARIGQAFSETPLAISLDENGIMTCDIPDVKSRDGLRVFSDGVGTISRLVMEAINASTPKRSNETTCFQIRWAGAKGMLSLDPRLEGYKMYVRPSMVKFQSTDNANLEICDMANKPIPMVLNRQTIKILEDMGVPNDWFFEMQKKRLLSLQLITAHIANTVSFLDRQKIADHIGFPQLLRRLDSIGIDYRRDRFMSSVVEATILCELRLLKHKARIPVANGVTLFGIMDEFGYLNEGEVYVTFENAVFISKTADELDNCQMIITRSPALHPGDIQLATNIIPPDHHPLRYLRNCIVFSQKGARDLPSCLSGGDLDGDIYGIIWDTEAVQGCKRVFKPADYPRAKPLTIGRPVKREDMSEFFIKFMSTDQLGVIAVKHMVLADQRDCGTVDPDCLLLAEMHSTGVDYSKTGIPVDMTLLKNINTNRYRPDFLSPAPPANIKHRTEISFDEPTTVSNDDEDEDENGPNYQVYKSDKINGQLYRAIDEENIWYQDIKIPEHRPHGVWTDLLQYLIAECNRKIGGIRWASAKTEAWEIRHAYEDAIMNAALEYSDHATKEITEFEVFTGTIFNRTGVQTRRQRDGSIRLKDEFDRILHWTQSMIRNGSDRSTSTSNKALALSFACLEIGSMYVDQGSRLGRGRYSHELQSFSVVAACCALKELDAAVREVQQAFDSRHVSRQRPVA